MQKEIDALIFWNKVVIIIGVLSLVINGVILCLYL